MTRRGKRSLTTTKGLVEPTPESVMAWNLRWNAERYGLDPSGIDDRAREIAAMRKPDRFSPSPK